MKPRLIFFAFWAWLFLFMPSAWAVLIETEKKVRIGGYLVSEDAQKIVVRTKTADGKDKLNVFDATKTKILHKVDLARLEKLGKDKPKAYHDYAKELAKEKADPEAMDLAFRLYVIAAYLDAPNLGKSSLLNMSALATQPADVRKYRAMAFLLDAKGDRTLLKADTAKPVVETILKAKVPPTALTRFQKALERYRTGDIVKAKSDANEKGAADYFAKAGLDKQKFLKACDEVPCTKCKKTGTMACATCGGKGKIADPMDPFGGFRLCSTCNGKGKQKCTGCDGGGLNPFPEDYLKAVLRAEVWAVEQIVTMEPLAKKSSGSWNNALNDQQTRIPLLALETITEYNPRQCVFRNGKWGVP
jgi:hypothetical protein